MDNKGKGILRKDFLKGVATLPFLGYFGLSFRGNIERSAPAGPDDPLKRLGLEGLDAPKEKLPPPTGANGRTIRIGLVGVGWRGGQLLNSLGYVHPDEVAERKNKKRYAEWVRSFEEQEDLNVEIAGVCDTFEVHTRWGADVSATKVRGLAAEGKAGRAKIYKNYRELVASDGIDAVIIATPDHTHAPIAMAAARAGKHVYLEKPMCHSVGEAVELRDTIKSTGVVFQLGHENRQQMSFKLARELYRKGVLGEVSMVQTYTNRNGLFGAWIRDDAFDHRLGNEHNIDWEEFLAGAPWHEFDRKRYFSWQRYSDYGTSVTGNDFSHTYDCVNQILDLGIADTVIASGGQYYYKDHGDMPDVINAVFNYPERGLTLTYDSSLKNGVYRQSHIMGSEASMDVDRAIMLYRDDSSERYKDVDVRANEPLYYYKPNADVDAVTSATAKVYLKSGYGSTFIDGKVIDATFLHLKEWVDVIRGQGRTSCHIDAGFDEAVSVHLANLAYENKKPVRWDRANEKAIIG